MTFSRSRTLADVPFRRFSISSFRQGNFGDFLRAYRPRCTMSCDTAQRDRHDTLDQLLPTRIPTTRTRISCHSWCSRIFRSELRLRSLGCGDYLPGTRAFHDARDASASVRRMTVGFFDRRATRHRTSDTPSPPRNRPRLFVWPVSSRASRSISSFSVKMNDFPDPECLPPMRTISRSSKSLSAPKGDATFVTSRRRTLSCAPCTRTCRATRVMIRRESPIGWRFLFRFSDRALPFHRRLLHRDVDRPGRLTAIQLDACPHLPKGKRVSCAGNSHRLLQ